MIVLSPAIDLVQAMSRAKLPKGVRWQAASLMFRDGAAIGILTRDVKGAQRPTAEVRAKSVEDIDHAVAEGARRLG